MWKKLVLLIVFCIVFIGVVFAISIEKEEAPKLATSMGIDLGTTYSRVGVYKNGYVEILANDQGNRTTPSWVAFMDSKTLIGEAAKNQADVNPDSAIFDVKRLLGRKFEDEEVQRYMKLVPYKIINKYGLPCIQVKIKDGKTEGFRPGDIMAMVLNKMRETAENYVGKRIHYAVITVPAYFNDAQMFAIKYAGTRAGLDDAIIINEPTAAAIAYGLDKKSGEKKNILVFDLGGGTLDVSILTINNGVFEGFEVVATNGDTHLGGEDFDQRVMEYFIKLIKRKHDNDISKDNRALGKLRRECERAKRLLSSQDQVHVEIESLFDGVDFWEPLTRACFEELNNDLFEKTLGPVKKVLEDAGLEKNQIDEIVLVGGSTRIPKVQQLLKDYFNGKEPNKGAVNPDEAVAYGAAVLGDIVSRKWGEKFFFDSLMPAPPRDCEEFRLSQEEINNMIREANEFAQEDRKVHEMLDARNRLEAYVYTMRIQINDKDKLADKLESNEKKKIENALKEALEWSNDNDTAAKEDYEEKLKEVEAVCNVVLHQNQKNNIIKKSSKFFLLFKSFWL